jgi:transcriptional regulator with XRE-family HTH domain
MADPAIVREISDNLKQMRLNQNLSQARLAKISGLSRVTISRMEGGRAATILTIVQILRALDRLDILNAFQEDTKVSPLQLFRMKKNQRQRASHPRKAARFITDEK